MDKETRLQSFRRGPFGRVLQLEAHHHPTSLQYVVLWDEILQAFPGVTNVLNGTVIVTWARDAALRLIDPVCIKYLPDKVLEVLVEETPTSLSSSFNHHTHHAPLIQTVTNPSPPTSAQTQTEQWVLTTSASMPPESLYASSAYSEETTGRNHFQRLHVPTETEASDSSDSDNEIMKVEEVKIHYSRPRVPTETETSDKFDRENEGVTTVQKSFENTRQERQRILYQRQAELQEQSKNRFVDANLDKPNHGSEQDQVVRQTRPNKYYISSPERSNEPKSDMTAEELFREQENEHTRSLFPQRKEHYAQRNQWDIPYFYMSDHGSEES